MDNSQEELSNKTNDKPWLFKKGNPGGPGRPPGKSLKEYSREYLASMTDEERQIFLEGIPKIEIWKMSEGNPENKTDLTTKGESLNKESLTPDKIAKIDEIALNE